MWSWASEIASEVFLDELLQLFQYPPRYSRALLADTLPLRYCAARFASKTPWRLPVSGHAAGLVTAALRVAGSGGDEGDSRGVHWVSGSGPGRKRIRLNRKPPAHLAGFDVQSRPRVWKRLRHVDIVVFLMLIVRGGDTISIMGIMLLFRTGLGWDDSRNKRRSTSPGLHV